jgi:hypothetical protein
MQAFQAIPAAPHRTGKIRAALKSAVDEICGTLARLFAYLGTLALFFIVGVYLWDKRPQMQAETPARPVWTAATRSTPAFAIIGSDLSYKSKSYRIFRHSEGGRRDVLRWDADGQAVAELEIYRPGGEFEPSAVTSGFGVIDSKFGPVTLLRLNDGACLGFMKAVDQPALRISGYVCQGETAAARAAAITCMLNRLSLIAAGNDARLAELFARADLKRADCRTDWVSGSDKPGLRGAM